MAAIRYAMQFSPNDQAPLNPPQILFQPNFVRIDYAGKFYSMQGDFTRDAAGTIRGHVTDFSGGGIAVSGRVNYDAKALIDLIMKNDTFALASFILQGDDQITGSSSVYFGLSGNDLFDRYVLDNSTLVGGSGIDTFDINFPQSVTGFSIRATDSGTVLSFAGRQFTLIGVERIAFTDGTLSIDPSAPFFDFAASARASVLRTAPSDFRSYNDAVEIAASGKQAYLAKLLAAAEDRTMPALIVYDAILGRTPDAAHLDALTDFVDSQIHSAGYQATLAPRLGGYEAMGLGLAETSEFASRYGKGSNTEVVSSAYQEFFGRPASEAQISHFTGQIGYFETLYVSAGISSEAAALKARGAALGQMIGYAAEEPTPTRGAAQAWLTEAANGNPTYGQPLDLI